MYNKWQTRRHLNFFFLSSPWNRAHNDHWRHKTGGVTASWSKFRNTLAYTIGKRPKLCSNANLAILRFAEKNRKEKCKKRKTVYLVSKSGSMHEFCGLYLRTHSHCWMQRALNLVHVDIVIASSRASPAHPNGRRRKLAAVALQWAKASLWQSGLPAASRVRFLPTLLY